MTPVSIDHAVLRQLPQPQMKRHRRPVFDVVAETLAGLKHNVLNDVAGIAPRGDAAVEPHSHHFLHSLTVPVEQRVRGLRIPGRVSMNVPRMNGVGT